MNTEKKNEKQNWQDEANTFSKKNEYIFKNGLFHDVKFAVETSGKQQIFKAHKLELAKASYVFERMFYGSVPQNIPVVIKDIEPDIFEELLSFIYIHELKLNSIPKLWDLYQAGHKYCIKLLLEKIGKKIIQLLGKDKTYCISSFEMAEYFDDEKLKTDIMEHITVHIGLISMLENFMDTKLTTFLLIVQQPKINLPEYQLFKILDKYHLYHVENKTKQEDYDEMIRKIVQEIRFLTFHLRTFTDYVMSSSLLTDSEKVKIALIINKSSDVSNMPDNFSLSTSERTSCKYLFDHDHEDRKGFKCWKPAFADKPFLDKFS